MHAMYSDAPLYTAFYEPSLVDPAFRSLDIRTGWMQALPGWRTHHQAYLPVYPLAFATTRVRNADVVLSNASAFCKGIGTPDGSVHVCYCLTPPRFVWMPEQYLARERYPAWTASALSPLTAFLRTWDRAAAHRVTRFVAISRTIADRIRRYYGRHADIVYPPVDTARFLPSSERENYFLIVSRLVPYKRIDLAVKACTELALPLVVIGEGRDREALRASAGPTVRFLGSLSDDQVSRYMARCRAFLFPGEEDFGIAPVEAQAAGRPVVAYAAGGALDTVTDGETGVLFREPTVASLAEALRRIDALTFNTARLVASAARFSTSAFHSGLGTIVQETWQTARAGRSARR